MEACDGTSYESNFTPSGEPVECDSRWVTVEVGWFTNHQSRIFVCRLLVVNKLEIVFLFVSSNLFIFIFVWPL